MMHMRHERRDSNDKWRRVTPARLSKRRKEVSDQPRV